MPRLGAFGVTYDLIGGTKLTRRTIAAMLSKVQASTFKQYAMNPEDFMMQAVRLKATMVVEHISYDPLNETHSQDIFTIEKPESRLDTAYKAKRHIYDYVVTDSGIERDFVEDMETRKDVVVYAKLPKSFFIDPNTCGQLQPRLSDCLP
ncbi:MAG: hypothetical protein COA87_006940 [Halomonas sp.]|nr:hypothetical protein [Halomonas sp.]MBL1267474.1 hypothetical protein [Halomonas sp.]